jgi:hypothetical protein
MNYPVRVMLELEAQKVLESEEIQGAISPGEWREPDF